MWPSPVHTSLQLARTAIPLRMYSALQEKQSVLLVAAAAHSTANAAVGTLHYALAKPEACIRCSLVVLVAERRNLVATR